MSTSSAPAPAVESLRLQAGTTTYISPRDHGVKGIGRVYASVADGWLQLMISHPLETDIRELFSWDNGAREVDARDEAESVLREHLGIDTGEGAYQDQLEITGGRLIFTHYERIGNDTVIDMDDFTTWTEDFAAIVDPDTRHRLATEITELYEQI